MIILEKNYENIPYVENVVNDPDVVYYKNILKDDSLIQITKLLKSFKFNDNGQILFSDNPLVNLPSNNLPSNNLPSNNLHVNIFPGLLEKLRDYVEQITDSSLNSCLITRYGNENTILSYTTHSLLFGLNRKLKFQSNTTYANKEIDIYNGSLLVERESIKEYWTTSLIKSKENEPFYILSFYHIYENKEKKIVKKLKTVKKKLPSELTKIYLNNKMRMAARNLIRSGLSGIRSKPEGAQCFMKNGLNELKQYVKLGKLIGSGDWGNVYSACLTTDDIISCRRKFAIKMSRITEEDYNDPYTETSTAWYEIWILKDIIKPLIKNNICPNLPLFFDTFLCNKCDFIFRKGNNTHPCVITAMELASGDMRDYLKDENPSDDEIYSALFQIMVGLHAIQMAAQVLNNDIKTKNILYYNVEPGGYWHYRIDNQDFFVPNFGKMFVLNDFGVSTLYDPNFQLYPDKKRNVFNLGSRYAINIDETFSPIEAGLEFSKNELRKTSTIKWSTKLTSNGATYKIDRKTGQVIVSHTILTPIQKSYLFRKGITTNPKTWGYFEHPYTIPPFEFYNDVQDTLRMIVGGKRTTQKGNHILYPSISKQVQTMINPYLGAAENSKTREFSLHTYHVLAGSFIKQFFTKTVNYTIKLTGKKIDFYNIKKK